MQLETSKKSFRKSPTQFKQIDSRWVQLKFANNFTSRSYFGSCIQAGNIYIYGGFSAQTGALKDFQVCSLYDHPSLWKKIQAKNEKLCNPGALRNLTLSSYSSNILLIGGQKSVVNNNGNIYRFDLMTNKWSICKCLSQDGNPFKYALQSHFSIIYKQFLYIIGGYDSNVGDYFTQVIKISLQKVNQDNLTFQIIKQKGPSPRANSSCCLVGNKIYVFGGDFWIFDLQKSKWQQIQRKQQNIIWPQKRRGATLVVHNTSNTLFLFGGIKKVTKQHNDVYVFIIAQNKWVRVHSDTNDLYDPSPTLKMLDQSPTIAEQKQKRQRNKSNNAKDSFRLGIKSVSGPQVFLKTSIQFSKNESSIKKTAPIITETAVQFKKKMSVVQQKKYRQFLNRKKKLLTNIQNEYDQKKYKKRAHSPTSEALIFSLGCMGQQSKQKEDVGLPKVIYDQQTGQVIGKKPCARDGHAALIHQDCMVILGGDRHMVAFNDAYLFKLNKAVQNLPHYQ